MGPTMRTGANGSDIRYGLFRLFIFMKASS